MPVIRTKTNHRVLVDVADADDRRQYGGQTEPVLQDQLVGHVLIGLETNQRPEQGEGDDADDHAVLEGTAEIDPRPSVRLDS